MHDSEHFSAIDPEDDTGSNGTGRGGMNSAGLRNGFLADKILGRQKRNRGFLLPLFETTVSFALPE